MVSIEEELSEEEEQQSLKKMLKSIALPAVATFLVFAYYNNVWVCTAVEGVMNSCWPLWVVWGVIFFTSWWSVMAFEKDLKLGTIKVVWTDGNTTTTGRKWPAGDFYIMRAGGFRCMGFEKEGSEGLLIFHKTSLNMLGRQIAIAARLRPTPFKKLPRVVREHILAYGFRKFKPYRYGLVDPQRYRLKIKVGEAAKSILPGKLEELPPELFNTLLDEANRTSYTYEKLSTASMNKLESLDSQIQRINASKGLWESITSRVKSKPEEE